MQFATKFKNLQNTLIYETRNCDSLRTDLSRIKKVCSHRFKIYFQQQPHEESSYALRGLDEEVLIRRFGQEHDSVLQQTGSLR